MVKFLAAFLAVLIPTFVQAASPTLAAKRVGTGFQRPVFATAPPMDTNRLFVVEQHSGRIRILNLSTLTTNTAPFLQITGLTTQNEQGLLGLAFHPGYATNGYFYVNYTTTGGGAAGHTEIRRFTVSSTNAEIANPSSGKHILSFNQPESNHNGGWIGFGSDGFLYIASGDGGGANDRHGTTGNGQDRNTLLGKMLRIDVDNGDPYSIPDGNPFKGDATKKPEIWAFGLRNPWRCSFDRLTGDLWIGDVGQNTREEINFLPKDLGGVNFGWRPREGFIVTPDYDGAPYPAETPVTPATDPLHDYSHNTGISVTGGYRYRGNEMPELVGTYIFADYSGARFWTFEFSGSITNLQERTSQIRPTPFQLGNVASFGEDASGELYFCDLGRGNVFKIVSAAPTLNNITHNGSVFSFQFEGYVGRTYTVETKSPLSTNTWTTVTNFTTANYVTNFTLTSPLGTTNKFYRVRTN